MPRSSPLQGPGPPEPGGALSSYTGEGVASAWRPRFRLQALLALLKDERRLAAEREAFAKRGTGASKYQVRLGSAPRSKLLLPSSLLLLLRLRFLCIAPLTKLCGKHEAEKL